MTDMNRVHAWTFEQRSWTISKKIIVRQDRLEIKAKTWNQDLEHTLHLDDLGFEIIRKRAKAANVPFYLFLLFDILYAGLWINGMLTNAPYGQQFFWMFSLLIFLVLSALTFANRNREWVYLTGNGKSLELLASAPDAASVNDFIERLHQHMRLYFRNKYMPNDPGVSQPARLAQLKWLRDNKVISDNEYLLLLDSDKGHLQGWYTPERLN